MRLGRSASAWSIVADTDNQRVDVLSPELTYLRSTPIPDPLQVAANASSIYVLSPTGYNYTLSQFANDSSLTPEASHVIAGIGDDQLTGPADIYDQLAVNDSGDLLLTDRSDQTILMYDPSLSFLGAWHESTPISGLAIGDYAGGQQLYFAENVYSNADIVRSDIQGHQQGTFGPTTVGGLSLSPWALATDSNGDVLSADEGQRVVKIEPAPIPQLSAAPTAGLTSQDVTFSGAGSIIPFWTANHYRWDLDGSNTFATDTGTSPSATHQFNDSGTYPIALQVTGTNGPVASTIINYVVGDLHAAFTSPDEALTNTAVTFDGSPSAIPHSTVSDYAWDFDGTGSYAVDSSNTPTTVHTFDEPGTYTVQLRVTRAGGRVDTSSGQIIVTPTPPTPPPGRVGVVINNGDYATNDPNVQIDPVWPAGAVQILISNNGGFGASGNATAFPPAAEIPWTLERTGAGRLPKTVYVRFLGAGVDIVNFTADIILDETAPTLQAAQLVGVEGATAASAARAKPSAHKYRIKIKAYDSTVGVCAVNASARKIGGTIVIIKNCHSKGILHLAKTVTIGSTSLPKYVRVRNSKLRRQLVTLAETALSRSRARPCLP